MNHSVFPAQPGTFLIERDAAGHYFYTPVVGWNHLQGNVAFPICAMNHGGLTHGKAIVHPDGWVTDPTHGLVFASVGEWQSFISKAKPKADSPAESGPDTRADAMPGTETPEDDNDAPAAATFDGDTCTRAPTFTTIQFGNKTFKTNSYWSMPSLNAIFQIEGGAPYPKDERCEKITRDDYAALKKRGAAVVDPHAGADPAEDDDDGMDLV